MTTAAATPALFELPPDLDEARCGAHSFAERYIRPVAADYDERETTPWPVIEEAATAGLYSPEFALQMRDDPTGLLMPVVAEEIFWGDGGIGQALLGTFLPVWALFGAATEHQISTWLSEFFGTPGDLAVAALCVSEPGAGSDVAATRTHARYDSPAGEQVLNDTKTWAANGGIARVHIVNAVTDPGSRARTRVVPGSAQHPRTEPRAEILETRTAGVTYRRSRPRQCPAPRGSHLGR